MDAAVAAARAAFASWSKLSGHARARYLYAIARNIQKHYRLLAVLESLDNGKPIRESRDIDIPLVARHFYYHAGWAQLMERELADYQPVGVVGQVIPWNFPLLMLAWKIAPALAMGNTVVIKPAPYTSLTALLFGEIIAEAGLPPGVVNVVTGGDQTGALITEHPDFDKIAFTGSTDVGRIIRRATAGSGKRLSLELGGKSPFVVFDDADQDAAVEGLVDAIWFNQGQVCCAGSRLLVQESIAERLSGEGAPADEPAAAGRLARQGDRHRRDCSIRSSAKRLTAGCRNGIAEGAEIYQPDCPLPEAGCWYLPTLMTNVGSASSVVQEEIFGPVVVAMTFRTPERSDRAGEQHALRAGGEHLERETSTSCSTWRARSKPGRSGSTRTNLFDAAAGFGGYRESGFGREGGREGLFEYVRPKWQERPRPGLTAKDAKIAKKNEAVTAPTDCEPARAAERSRRNASGLPAHRPDGEAVHRRGAEATGRQLHAPDLRRERRGSRAGADGNRKDIRDAVEAARKAEGWGLKPGHTRAQILYYIAENLNARADEFARRLVSHDGRASSRTRRRRSKPASSGCSPMRLTATNTAAAMQETPLRGMTLGLHEPVGVIGIACPDEAPLLAFVSLFAPAIARGNTVVIVPSERYPAERHRFLSSAGNVRPARRRGQHRHRRARRADQDAGGSR